LKHSTLYAVGKIVKAFGINGEVIVTPMTNSPARFKKLKRVFVGPNDTEVEERQIVRAVVQPRGVRLLLSDVKDRNSAERVVGALVFVTGEDRITPPKGTYFVHDIIGLSVVDEQSTFIGKVKDILKMPANDVYVIDVGGREVLLPAVKEFIREINLEEKMMKVRLIEGMLE
jgi:16S rRNA processing protein RimM